jgi:hypothetical protein
MANDSELPSTSLVKNSVENAAPPWMMPRQQPLMVPNPQWRRQAVSGGI